MKKILIIALIASFCFSCKKSENADKDIYNPDVIPPNIEILLPNASISLQNGTIVSIKINFSDNILLKSYQVSFKETTGSYLINSTVDSVQLNTTSFETQVNISNSGNYELYTYAEDINGNFIASSKQIQVTP